MSKNAAYEKRLRNRIFDRDGWKCYLCDRVLTDIKNTDGSVPMDYATIDHVIPRSNGGHNRQTNKRACCWSCNNIKGSKSVGKSIRKIFAVSNHNKKEVNK